jgi:transposase
MEPSSEKELKRAYYIKAACNGLFTVREVAERLELCPRRVKYLKAAYHRIGDAAFVHGNKGRPSPNKVPDAVRRRIVELKTTEACAGLSIARFIEKLRDQGIDYNYSTIRSILLEAGLIRRKRPTAPAPAPQ